MVAPKNETAASILEREPKPSDEIEGEDDMVPVGCLVTFPRWKQSKCEPQAMMSPTSGSQTWLAIKSCPKKMIFPFAPSLSSWIFQWSAMFSLRF